jgi:hypothetical protein
LTDYVTQTVTDESVIDGGGRHAVHFQPAQPGPIGVQVTPKDPPTRSETGKLALLELYRPGRSQPLASYLAPLGAPLPLPLAYTATAADLASAGNWSCLVQNATETPTTFDTAISYQSLVPLEHTTATFDVELLNIMLAEAVVAAGLSAHIQSSSDPSDKASYIAWSANVGSTLPGSLANTTSYSFHLPDYHWQSQYSLATVTWAVIRIANLNIDPASPPVVFVDSANGVPAAHLSVSVTMSSDAITIIDSDVDLDEVGISLSLSSFDVNADADFYGDSVSAQAHIAGTATIAGVSIDLSEDVTVQTALNGILGGASKSQVRGYIDGFFINLMRLGSTATVDSYVIDPQGQTLTVSYSFPAPLRGVHPVRPPVTATGEGQ